MLDKNQSKVVLPSWVWEGVQNEKEAKAKGDIALCERENA